MDAVDYLRDRVMDGTPSREQLIAEEAAMSESRYADPVTAAELERQARRIAELEAALRNMLDIVEALEPNAITFTEKDEANAARAVLGS